MKRSKLIKSSVLGVALAAACCSPAFAYFEDGKLFMGAYCLDSSTEVGTDLGAMTNITMDYHGDPIQLAAAGTLSLEALGASSWGDVRLGYVSYNTTNREAYFAQTDQQFVVEDEETYEISYDYTRTPGYNKRQMPSFQNSLSSVRNGYNLKDTGSPTTPSTHAQVTMSTGDRQSYTYLMDNKAIVPGSYAGLSASSEFGSATLEKLDEGGYVDMYLYNYQLSGQGLEDVGPEAETGYVAVLRMLADGSVWLVDSKAPATSAVPIPGTLLLFGSSLLGFFGFRKNSLTA